MKNYFKYNLIKKLSLKKINIFSQYLAIIAISLWGLSNQDTLLSLFHNREIFFNFLAIFAIYASTHILRLIRIYILLVEDKEEVINIQLMHIHSAFIGSLMPYKIGEFVRLIGFIFIGHAKRNSFALWFSERFLDLISIAILIGIIWIVNLEISDNIEYLFKIYALFVFLIIFFTFAIKNLIFFLNRYLVLNSISERSFKLLRFGNSLEKFWKLIVALHKKRLPFLVFLSLIIWFTELTSVFIFIKLFLNNVNVSEAFTAILIGNVDPVSQIEIAPFIFYRTSTLGIMTFIFYFFYGIKKYFKKDFVYG
ncbi:hypothetical protein FIT69_04230 [Candidatus Methylopumilus planktonicus]|uniref:lysylphosphatidylglycerol synthase domain-containing protein n=1 Tax=Candidatus Methylopumilus planktonicus TaxID=1581557 RepID=UPI00112489D7|nr:lysylphosphatidylglycerol synthase domain-containing protein [Candidatus Methylopumilus planktonicus]QDD01780.1 hypothetical protein FIT69_04230 [Candidatus Methylopumilus planktonicus]